MTAGSAVLGTTLSVAQEPGANLVPGDTGNWRFLLPTLQPRHVLCLDPPGRSRLAILAELAERVTVNGNPGPLWRLAAMWSRDTGNVSFRSTQTPELPADVDLVVTFGRGARKRIERLRAHAGTGTALFGEWRRPIASASGRDGVGGSGDGVALWLRPPFGSVAAAAPARDDASIRWLCDAGHDRSREGLTPARKIRRRILDHDAVRRRVLRQALLAGPRVDGQLPAYIRWTAAEAGFEFGPHRWAMSAPSRYRSKKIVFFVFDPDSQQLRHIVKVTRHSDLNYRLENEWDAITRLGGLFPERVPEASFLGHHAGLALLGQAAVRGSRLRPGLDAQGVGQAATATQWLEDLAGATVQYEPATQVALALTRLVDRFDDLYKPAPGLLERLHQQVETIGASSEPFPVVFQHGDPGVWNALTLDGGPITFLDWEAADPSGMPLWDLLYFMRSYGVGAARAAGTRDTLDGFARVYLEESPLRHHLTSAIRSYRDRIGLDANLVDPLFHLCWLHRAVKEATRLPATALSRGHYLQLLVRGMERRLAPLPS